MSLIVSSNDVINSGVLYIGFNQECDCFAVGLKNGLRVFNTDPLKLRQIRDFSCREGGGVGYVSMLHRSNFLGLLGGGSSPKFQPNVCQIWDDSLAKFVSSFKFGERILAVKLHKLYIILVQDRCIKVYSREANPQLLYRYDTALNCSAVCAVSYPYQCSTNNNSQLSSNRQPPKMKRSLLAFPGPRSEGTVLIAELGDWGKPLSVIKAHQTMVTILTLTEQGDMLATASLKGTLIRIFNTSTCEIMYELRRGCNQANIYSIGFNADSSLVCASSDNGTIHIFKLQPTSLSHKSGGPQALLPKCLNAQTSDIRWCLKGNVKAICAFSRRFPDTLIVLSSDGFYSKYRFTEHNGEVRESFINFLDFSDDDSS